jgi:hypothetical protein
MTVSRRIFRGAKLALTRATIIRGLANDMSRAQSYLTNPDSSDYIEADADVIFMRLVSELGEAMIAEEEGGSPERYGVFACAAKELRTLTLAGDPTATLRWGTCLVNAIMVTEDEDILTERESN